MIVFLFRKISTRSYDKNDIFNIGPDEEFVTIKQLAEMVIDELEFTEDIIYMPDRPKEIKYATCDASKARDMLGYATSTTLQQGLRETIRYIKQHGAKPFDYSYPVEIINDHTPRTWIDKLI